MVRSILAGAVFLFVAACATSPAALTDKEKASETAAITALLEAQDVAWNKGDIDGFMQGYWQSPELRFASGGTVTRGYDQTVARYKTTYSTPGLMGTLETGDHEIIVLSPDAAIAHGHWQLTRAVDAPSGLYTLVLRKIDGNWRIVSDTTTSAE